jgi:hypothetical protein
MLFNVSQQNRDTTSVAQRFGKDEDKFAGALKEFLSDFIRAYRTHCQSLSLRRHRQVVLFCMPFRGGALDYYYEHVADNATDIEEAIHIMRDKYEGRERREHIRQLMSTLKVDDFVRSAQPTPIEWSSALDELVHTIASYVKQYPPDFQTPAHQVITLQNAVIHHDWAKDPLRRMSESKYDLPTFHQALGKELQFLSAKQSVSRIAQKTSITPQP